MSNTVKFNLNLEGSITPEEANLSVDDQIDSGDDDDDQNWDDWNSDSVPQACKSLFEDKTLPSVKDILQYDKDTHGFDLFETYKKLGLDLHQRIRLVNYIRKHKPSVADIGGMSAKEPFLFDDEYLRPVLEDDPLLLIASDDVSDSDSDDVSNVTDPSHRIRVLEEKLAAARKDLIDYRAFVNQQLKSPTLSGIDAEGTSNVEAITARDDDSHYFDSYDAHDIHAIMIQDQIRTSTYASFILRNPSIFNDAVVLDVGCGTGILSLFAARGGAKRVIAVDASGVAEKAKEIVKANGLEDIITVIRGKVEDITLPDGITQVDVIVSEWMGYALLYESMLDSVLCARDRFLRQGGIMAPSQCRIMLGLCDASEILKDRVEFWDDIYGFDLSVMAKNLYDEAITDVIRPEKLLSEPCVVKDLYLPQVTPRQLDFISPFSLVSTTEHREKVSAFVAYFDTFFNVTGEPVPAETKVHVVKPNEPTLAEVWPVGGKRPPQRRKSSIFRETEKITSFSTGPQSIPTHWKQTLFLLREPITVVEGTTVNGMFHCRKSDTNSRELEVEIHYSVRAPGAQVGGDVTVQIYKVR